MVVARGVDGEVGIMANHAPMLIELAVAPVRLVEGDTETGKVLVDGGFLHVTPGEEETRVDVLAEHAVLPSEVDVAAARARAPPSPRTTVVGDTRANPAAGARRRGSVRREAGYFGGGGTRQTTRSDTFPASSTANTAASPWPVMCHCTALPGPPMGFWLGVAPGACVYLILTPLSNGPNTVPLPRSTRNTSGSGSTLSVAVSS